MADDRDSDLAYWKGLATKRAEELQALQDEWKEMAESTAELEKTLLAEIDAVC